MANGLLSPVELQTRDVFGMVPMEERLSLLPRYSKSQGLIAPQFIYELAKAVAAPITAAKGYSVSPEEAINVSMAGMGGGAFGSAPKGSLRTFIGRNAKTWDKAAESKFLELEKKGVSPEEMWKQTGTFRSPDKQLRQEISDLPAFLKGSGSFGDVVMNRLEALEKAGIKQIGDPVTIGDIYYHPQLLEAYPNLAKIEAEFMPKGKTAKGQIGENTLRMQFDLPKNEAKSIMLHELQHGIQDAERFATGGSPSSMVVLLEKLAEQKRSEARKLFDLSSNKDPLGSKIVKPGARKKGLELEKEARSLEDKALAAYRSEQQKFDLYQRLGGEAEARAVQARMNMTPAQRAQTFPLQSYDVPINELIIRGLVD